MAKRTKVMPGMDHGSEDRLAVPPRMIPSRPAVRVECPRESEAIARPAYTFHIAATPGADHVEVSIDKGYWMPCREALGVWWYDWSGFGEGAHELVARSRMGDGLMTYSDLRRFSAV